MFLLQVRKLVPSVILPVFIFIRIFPHELSSRVKYGLVVWDTQTGVVTTRPSTRSLGEVAFSGDQRTIALFCGSIILMYDGLEGTALCEEVLPLCWPGAHQWVYEGSLRYAAISFDNAINIYELQFPISAPLFSLVESFPIPSHNARFSFSPVSSHASFVTVKKILIIDVRDPRILLQIDTVELLYMPPGHFSPDGLFFACGTYERDGVFVWKNTSTGYIPWSNLKLRSPFAGFSFSPASTSILSWGSGGIQLLHPEDCLGLPFPSSTMPHHRQGTHLVAYSAGGTHIATARQLDSWEVILDPLSGTPRQFIDTGVQIWDIGIVGNTVFVVDKDRIVGWHLEVGGEGHGADGAGMMVVDETVAIGVCGEHLTLSRDCSRIAFADGKTVFLYDVKAREILDKCVVDMEVIDIRLSPNQHGIQVTMRSLPPRPSTSSSSSKHLTSSKHFGLPKRLTRSKPVNECNFERPSPWDYIYYFMELGITKDGGFVNDTPREHLHSTWPIRRHLQSHGYRIGSGFGWVEDSRGNKLLWLPPSWRTLDGLDLKWDGNFLALLGGHNPVPIIIEFQSPLAPSPTTL